MNHLVKIWNLIDNYVIKRLTSGVSTSSFWYLPEPSRLDPDSDPEILCNGLKSPLHVIDYVGKLEYEYVGDDGIIVLPYGGSVGDQINPLACFQYALGAHDKYVLENDRKALETFMYYADYFRKNQGANGEFYYVFDWYEIKAPWTSALAQSKGASVMLRAWLLTSDESYKYAAQQALKLYSVSIQKGGYEAVFEPEGCTYYEEYPQAPHAALNGFMASLFGPWEMCQYLKDGYSADIYSKGIESLERMLPYYTTAWWTLYDLDPMSPIDNVHSSRYQRMVIGYMRAFASISGSAQILKYLQLWQDRYTRFNRVRATALKAYRKIVYR